MDRDAIKRLIYEWYGPQIAQKIVPVDYDKSLSTATNLKIQEVLRKWDPTPLTMLDGSSIP